MNAALHAVAADTNVMVAYLEKREAAAEDVQRIHQALTQGELFLPPMVLAELFSAPASAAFDNEADSFSILEPRAGYWMRAARLRRKLLDRRLKSRMADALIAQSCIDYNIPLVTRDRDFRHFSDHGLKLFMPPVH